MYVLRRTNNKCSWNFGGNKVGEVEFIVGDYITIKNVTWEHYNNTVSLNSTDDTETEVSYYDNFFNISKIM